MDTLMGLISALSGLFAAGAIAKIISLAIQMGGDPDNRRAILQQIKSIITVLIISLVVSGGSLAGVLTGYFS